MIGDKRRVKIGTADSSGHNGPSFKNVVRTHSALAERPADVLDELYSGVRPDLGEVNRELRKTVFSAVANVVSIHSPNLAPKPFEGNTTFLETT